MWFEKEVITISKQFEVLHCKGHGQCQCKSCKDKGIYNIQWTDWCYKLNESDDGVLCYDCLLEKLKEKM